MPLIHRKITVPLAILAFVLSAPIAMTALGQEEDAETDVTEQAETDDAATAEADDSDLDEQVYEDRDDDFRPSEEIPADQSIPFPTDI